MTFRERLFEAIKRLLTSTKFMTLIVGIIVSQAAKRGIILDPSSVNEIVGLFAALIVAQGAADLGKGRAQVEVANPKPPETVNVQAVNLDPNKTPKVIQ